MKHHLSWLGVALTIAGSQAQAQSTAANPDAPVPVVSYRSAFSHPPAGVEKQTEDWKTANQTVGQFTNGFRDVLKWEEAEAARQADHSAAPGKAASDAPPPTHTMPMTPKATKH